MRYFLLSIAVLLILGGVWHADGIGLFKNGNSGSGLASDETSTIERVPIPPLPDETGLLRGEESEPTSSLKPSPEDAIASSGGGYARILIGADEVVEAVSDPSTECIGSTFDRFRCYGDYYALMVNEEGIEAAFVDLKSRYRRGDVIAIPQCHQLTHVIGRAATQIFPTVAESYGHGDSFCWSGYYHGIMEAIIAEIGLENVPDRLNDICADLPGKETYSFNYYNCVHGLGHGVMYVEGHDLFIALETCDLLEGWWERESCYSGAFMENIIANEVDHVSYYLKDGDLLYPCNAVGKPYKQSCWLMHTSYMLKQSGENFNTVFNLCAEVESPYMSTCYQSLGRDASGRTVSNVERTKAICLSGPSEFAQEHCIVGAVKDFISYYHSDTEARELCASLEENDLQTTCLRTAESYYAVFTD